jgi:hypothetical protein
MISWVLLVFFGNSEPVKSPIALPATSREHCIRLHEMVKTVQGHSTSTCFQLSSWIDIKALYNVKDKE